MDYSKPTDDGQKSPPPHGGQPPPPVGTPVIPVPPQDYQQPPLPPPPAQQDHGGVHGHWTTGLFDCHTDIPNSCVTFWCPCITFGQIAEIVDKGSTSCGVSGALYTLIAVLTGWPCLYSCFYRWKMRRQYDLPETPLPDILVHLCCEMCALCQEYRHLKNHGFNMSLGWDGANVETHNQGVTLAPVVQGGMTR